MSVHCQLGFYHEGEKNLENWEVLIYRHLDGYPKAVLADILPILKEIDEAIGFPDVEYASAFLVAQLKRDYKNIGISKEFHGDIDYYYQIFRNRIKVYQCRYGQHFSEWKLIETIKLGGEK